MRQKLSAGGLYYSMTAQSLQRQQNTLLKMFPACCFAKFDRSKPHLNVGTIGKFPPTEARQWNAPSLLQLCGLNLNYNFEIKDFTNIADHLTFFSRSY
jgi:hypothetical protein